MLRWLTGRGASQRSVARQMALITDESWRALIARYDFFAGLSLREDEALRQRAAWLLASKDFSGAAGLNVNDDIMLVIAAQAALPIMELDPALYEGWNEIILYPGGFVVPCTDMDESGVVHEYMQAASGEAWEGGPVILSWEDSDARATDGANVVIHEFAHKLDLYAGEADGMPFLGAHGDLRPRDWLQVLQVSFDAFCERLDAIEKAIPADVDPESDQAQVWYERLPLDAYAATDHAEFFAVSSEQFFVDPEPLAQGLPYWYDLLKRYYRQDPRLRRQQR